MFSRHFLRVYLLSFSAKRFRSYLLSLICMSSLLLWIDLSTIKDVLTEAPATHVSSSSYHDSSFNHWAVALKTGKDIALQRTPIQLLTYLACIKNLIVIGEAPGFMIGSYEMIDVYTDLYTNMTANNNKSKRVLRQADQQVKVDLHSVGWNRDPHKNLPGFMQLWQRFPNAEWYIMLDDDTYLFTHNLKSLLSQYDPNEEHYLGSVMTFVGCDGVKEWDVGPGFAHGGSGIVVSRGALKRIIPDLNQCILKYKDCWAGDIRTALCLRDQGVLAADPGGFNANPPHHGYWFNDACRKPITFHHLLVSQLQKLWTLEQTTKVKFPGKAVDMSDIYLDWHLDNGLEQNTDRSGADVKSIDSLSTNECLNSCREIPDCMAFTFADGKCWLKNDIPPKTEKKGHASGVVRSHFVCRH